MPLTEDQIMDYLGDGGKYCPSCKSENIESDRVAFKADECWLECECLDCKFKWADVYYLDDVVEVPRT